jgi:multidrug efflux pump subunit AcrA (membrane-fusion protein)
VLPVIALGGFLILGGGIAALVYTQQEEGRPDVLLHPVKYEDLQLTVVEKGTLESAENKDVVCRVKAGAKGQGGYATSINWVIDDGSMVNEGQLLMILDDSALQDQLRAQKIVVDTALAAKIKAEKDYEITVKENERKVAEAENLLAVAKITLEQYIGLSYDKSRSALAAVLGAPVALAEDGAYRQAFDDLTGQVQLAESEVEQTLERAAWADRMVKLTYMSPAQAQAERSKYESAKEKLRALQSKRSLLANFERRMNMTNYRSEVENKRLLLEKEVLAASASEVQYDTDRISKRSIYLQELDKLKEIEDQIKECKIYAPQAGMVVYFKNESSRYRSSDTGLIEQGAQVKEGQKMLRIPNLKQMQVNTKVHEAMVARIRGDVRVATGVVEKYRAGLLTTVDPFSRLVTQNDSFMTEVRDKFRDQEYYTAQKGQRATIRVDAKSEILLPGRVRSVAAVASASDSWVNDVKLYPTLVLIEQELEGLRPDMTAEVTIHVDGVKNILTVPIQSIVGGAEMGGRRSVYVKTDTGFDERRVVLGLYNEKMVEVREGLKEGDQVVINPKVLLGENRAKTRSEGDDHGGGDDKSEGKGKRRGPEGGGKYGDGPGAGGGPEGASPGGAGGGGAKKKGNFDPSKKRKGGGGGGGAPRGGAGGPPAAGE